MDSIETIKHKIEDQDPAVVSRASQDSYREDVAVEPLLEWRFAEWEDGRLKGFDVGVPQELSDSYAQDEKGGGFK